MVNRLLRVAAGFFILTKRMITGRERRWRVGGGNVAARRSRRVGARRIRELRQREHHDQWEKFPRKANLNCAAFAGTGCRHKRCNSILDNDFSPAYNSFL
jgi:hypothetical protein